MECYLFGVASTKVTATATRLLPRVGQSTPVDCVRFGYSYEPLAVDTVLSAFDTALSVVGTVLRIPSLIVSNLLLSLRSG